jgi:hypothetical protein
VLVADDDAAPLLKGTRGGERRCKFEDGRHRCVFVTTASCVSSDCGSTSSTLSTLVKYMLSVLILTQCHSARRFAPQSDEPSRLLC